MFFEIVMRGMKKKRRSRAASPLFSFFTAPITKLALSRRECYFLLFYHKSVILSSYFGYIIIITKGKDNEIKDKAI